MAFLSNLYKENIDALLYTNLGGHPEDWIAVTTKTTTAKFCNMLFNLPEVIKGLEVEFEKQKEQKEKFIKAQESGAIQMLGKKERGI